MDKLDYNDIKEHIFNIIKTEEKKVNIEFLLECANILEQNDLFEIFYLNSNLRLTLKSFIIEMLEQKKYYLTTDQILSVLFSYNDSDKLIEYYFPIFLENTNNLLDLKENVEIYENLLKSTNNYMDSNEDITIKHIVEKNLSYFGINNFSDDSVINKLGVIFKEVFNHEGLSVSSISQVGLGSSTSVYGIGNKVIKFGVNKPIFENIEHPRILKPLFNNKLNLNTEEKHYIITTEATNFVDTDNIKEEDSYIVFKELKNSGFIWTDPQPDNLGRIMIDGEEFIVIIDAEYIYKEDYPNIEIGNYFYFDRFDKRYQEEMKIEFTL